MSETSDMYISYNPVDYVHESTEIFHFVIHWIMCMSEISEMYMSYNPVDYVHESTEIFHFVCVRV